VTSYAEVALNSPAADHAHPAFSKLFIQTESFARKTPSSVRADPRPREQPPWMFHLMLVQGEEIGEVSFETDRARFLGRGNTAALPW